MTRTISAIGLIAICLTGCKSGPPAPQLTLLEAAELGDLDTVNQRLKEGADVNKARERTGATPLMLAVGTGKKPVVEAILAKGANVNAVNSRGYNAILIAVGNDDVEMVKLLKMNGADLSAKSKQGYTAYYIAKMYKFQGMMDYLKSVGADTSDPQLSIQRKAPARG